MAARSGPFPPIRRRRQSSCVQVAILSLSGKVLLFLARGRRTSGGNKRGAAAGEGMWGCETKTVRRHGPVTVGH